MEGEESDVDHYCEFFAFMGVDFGNFHVSRKSSRFILFVSLSPYLC